MPIEIDSSRAEKHILDDEAEARAYFDQLWAEAMVLYDARSRKSMLLKFSPTMQKEIDAYRKQFMQEDTMAGTVQGWLDNYDGDYVCTKLIWKEAFDHPVGEPKKFETNEIAQILDTQIVGWKRGKQHRFTKEGLGSQRSWVRENFDESVNEPDEDGFVKIEEGEQMTIPFV